MAAKRSNKADPTAPIAENRRARHAYEVLETFEAGLVLKGTEVKTLRAGNAQIDESHARIQAGEAWLVGAHIEEYSHGNAHNHKPTRRRKLLLKKSQIRKLEAQVKQKGLTLVPLKLYFSDRGFAKLLFGLCKGRKTVDKRQNERKREAEREMRRQG
ncbi:MAG: SsrA-binding protein SmpB [Planctomycetota bacterium]